jgi:periplasmic divalent cation tolerance protein
MSSTYLMVFCTCPTFAIAEELAKKVIEDKLAACANIIPGVTSIYTWEGKTEISSEVQLLFKTTTQTFNKLEVLLNKMHPYDCPEIIGVPIEHGNTGYLQWLKNSVS